MKGASDETLVFAAGGRRSGHDVGARRCGVGRFLAGRKFRHRFQSSTSHVDRRPGPSPVEQCSGQSTFERRPRQSTAWACRARPGCGDGGEQDGDGNCANHHGRQGGHRECLVDHQIRGGWCVQRQSRQHRGREPGFGPGHDERRRLDQCHCRAGRHRAWIEKRPGRRTGIPASWPVRRSIGCEHLGKPSFAQVNPAWGLPGIRATCGQAPMQPRPAAPISPTCSFRCSESASWRQLCP